MVLVLPCCQALPPPFCCCPCCVARPCVLSSFAASCFACGAVVRCAGALASCSSFWSALLPFPGIVVLFCVLCWFFWRSVVQWYCPAVCCGVSWCPGAPCCMLWCCAAVRCCAARVCRAFLCFLWLFCSFFSKFLLFLSTFRFSFNHNLKCLLKIKKIRHYPSHTTHPCSKTLAFNLRVAGCSW